MPHKIHQEVIFSASPNRIYESLVDSREFSKFTGLPAQVSSEAGGSFSCFGGAIVGRNVELVPNKRIVQAWRVGDWVDGIYSIARFELRERPEGTQVIFDHTGFPEDQFDHLSSGWYKNYWDPLRKYLS